MALQPGSGESVSGGEKKGFSLPWAKKEKTPEAKPVAHATYLATAFRPEVASPGAVFSSEARDTGATQTAEVALSNELHSRFEQRVSQHITNLYNHPGLLNKLKNSPDHRHEYTLALALAKTDEKGQPITNAFTDPISGKVQNRMVLDEAKLANFFSSKDTGVQGWAGTDQLITQLIGYRSLAENLRVEFNPRANRNSERGASTTVLDTGVESGPYSEGWHKFTAWLQEGIPSAGGRQGPIPRWLSLGPAAVVFPYTIYHELTKRGLSLKLIREHDLKQVFNANPQTQLEKEYLKVVCGLDIDNPTKSIVSSSESKQLLAQDVMTHFAFLQSIGVPPDKIDALPEQYLLEGDSRWRKGSHEQTGTYWEAAVRDEYERKIAQLPNPSKADRIRVYHQARSKICNNQFKSIMENRDRAERMEKEASVRTQTKESQLSQLRAQKQARESASAVKDARAKVYKERMDALEKSKAKLAERKTKQQSNLVEVATRTRKDKEAEIKDIERRLTTLYAEAGQPLQNPPNDTLALIDAYIDNVDSAIGMIGTSDGGGNIQGGSGFELKAQTIKESNGARINNLAQTLVAEVERRIGEEIRAKERERDRAQQGAGDLARLQNAVNAIDILTQSKEQQIIDARETAKQTAKEQIESEQGLIRKNIQELRDLRAALKAKKQEYQEAVRAENEAKRDELKSTPVEVAQNVEAYARIVMSPPQNGSISYIQLRTSTVDELYKIVVARGSPYRIRHSSDTQIAELRDLIARAKAEAMAEDEAQWQPSPASQQLAYRTLLGKSAYDGQGAAINRILVNGQNVAISENDLIRQGRDEILHRIKTDYFQAANNPYANQTDATILSAIDAAKAEAEKRLRIANRLYVELALEDNENQTKQIQQRIDKDNADIDRTFATDNIKLGAAIRLVERHETIYTAPTQVIEHIAQYTDVTVVTAQDAGYTQPEVAAGHPKGYYEMLQLFFGYQDDITTRAERFAELSNVYKPADLAKLLNDQFNLGVASPPQIALVLAAFNARVNAGNNRLNPVEMSQGFLEITKLVVDQMVNLET